MGRHVKVLALLLGVLLAAAGCGGADSGSSAPDGAAAAATASTTEEEPSPSTSDTPATSSEADATDALAPAPLAERATLRIGLAAYVEAFAPVLMAAEMGEFEAENIEVEIFNALPSDVLLLLSQGKADVSAFAVDAGIFNAVQRGIDVRWASALLKVPDDTNEGMLVSPDLVGDDPSDFDFSKLEGQKIAVSRSGLASAQTHDLRTALTKGGLTLDDIEIVPLSSPEMVTAMETGAVVAVNTSTDPFASQIITGGHGVLVQPLLDDIAKGGYFMRSGMFDENREVGLAFFRAIMRANEKYLQPGYHDDPEIVAALSRQLDAPEDAIAAAPEKVFAFEVPDGSFDTLQSMFLEIGQLEYDEPMVPADMIDTSLVDELTS